MFYFYYIGRRRQWRDIGSIAQDGKPIMIEYTVCLVTIIRLTKWRLYIAEVYHIHPPCEIIQNHS